QLAPGKHRLFPLVRVLTQNGNSSGGVLSAFGVVGRRRDHAEGPRPGTLGIVAVEIRRWGRKPRGAVSHLVTTNQSAVPIKRRVFDGLSHDRARELLKAERKRGVALLLFLVAIQT